MGVHRLTAYIEGHKKAYLKPHQLSNCYLVVDGNALACTLFEWRSKSISAFGGDYDEYCNVVRDFFLMLQKCAVTPIVLFDGGYKSRKAKKALEYNKEKVYHLKCFSKKYSMSKLFPVFMKEAFNDVMVDLGITYAYCYLEADPEIATLARALNCPVLSNDSDFYIFDVLYIPLTTVAASPLKYSDSSDFYIECCIYDVNNFLNQFEGLSKPMLPLIAALLGNDYTQGVTFTTLFKCNGTVKTKRKYYQKKIHDVIHFLKNKTFDTALKMIVKRLGKEKGVAFLKSVKISQEVYSNPFISKSVWDIMASMNGELCQDKQELTINLLPEILQLYHEGRINKFILDIINLGVYITPLQVEDVSYQSSHFISLQFINDIWFLLSTFSDKRREILKVCLSLKNTYGALKLPKNPSQCLHNIKLQNILEESKEKRLKLLCQIVGVDENDLSIVSNNNWSLFLMSFIYWVRETEDEVFHTHAHAIILMAIANQVVQKDVGYFKSCPQFLKKKGKLLESLKEKSENVAQAGTSEDFEGMLADVTLYEKLLAQNALIPYRTCTDEAWGSRFSISIVHLFARFQSCVFHIAQLNALLNLPLPPLRMSEFYSGTLLYNLYLCIKAKPPLEKIAYSLFKDAPNLRRIYDHLQTNLCKYLSKTSPAARKTKRKKRKKLKIEDDSKDESFSKSEDVISSDEEAYDDENNPYALLSRSFVALSIR